MKYLRLSVIFLAAVFVLGAMTLSTGCALLDEASENPVVVRIAVSQAVLRYIDQGDSAEAQHERRRDVLSVMTQTLEYIDSGAQAPVESVMQVLLSLIDFDRLSLADQYLVHETVALVHDALLRRVELGELESDQLLVLREIILTAIRAAQYQQ